MAWELFKNYLFSNRSGSLVGLIAKLCIVGIAMGVFSFIVVLSIMNGFNESIYKRYLAIEPHITIKDLPKTKFIKQAKDKNIDFKSVLEFERQDVFIRTIDGNYSGAIAKGYKKEGLVDLIESLEKNKKKKPESTFNPLEIEWPELDIKEVVKNLKPKEVIIGMGLASSLALFEGDKIQVMSPESLLLPPGEVPVYENLVVRSILATEVPEYDNHFFFYNKDKSLSRFSKAASLENGLEVKVAQPMLANQIKDLVNKPGWNLETWIERNSVLFFALKIEKITMGTFLGLSALITSFSIITILYLLMMQKKQDIGIFLAMGLSVKRVKRLFTQIGLILSSIGIVSGLVFGLLFSFIVQALDINIMPDIYYDSSIPIKIEPLFILYVILASCLVAFITSWLPSHKLANFSPVDCLRGKKTNSSRSF